MVAKTSRGRCITSIVSCLIQVMFLIDIKKFLPIIDKVTDYRTISADQIRFVCYVEVDYLLHGLPSIAPIPE